MKAVTENLYSEEQHPWDCYIPEGATNLFIGTFPAESRKRKYDFFYSSATNRFWEIIKVLVKPLDEIIDDSDEVMRRKEMLGKLKLGLTDMGRRILRQQGSSNDNSLFPLEFIDITRILDEYQTIDTIFVSGNSNGNSSLSWFGTFCSINGICFNTKEVEKKKSGAVIINNKLIKVKLAYSPSRMSRVKTETILENYKLLLYT